MILRRIGFAAFWLLLGLVLTVILASGIFQGRSYLEPWKKDYYQKFRDIRLQVISHGLLAPNGHNMQPWKIKLDHDDPSVFYLYGDSSRLTPEVDPPARQFTISQGTFLEYCSVAANHLSCDMETIPFPNGEYDGTAQEIDNLPVAKVTIKQSGAPAGDLYDALYLPDTSRVAYKNLKLSGTQLKKLMEQNDSEGLTLKIYQDAENMEKISRYVTESAKIEGSIQEMNRKSMEITRINEYQKNKLRSGFSMEGTGATGLSLYTKEALVTLFPALNSEAAAKDAIVSQAELAVKNTPAYVMILSKDNMRTSQLQAGILYSRVQLAAETMGLAVQPLSQSIEEYPQMDTLYREIHRDYAPQGATIQMLFRIGTPVQDTPLSMRRDVSDLLEHLD